MFWSDWGRNPKIERANMDGTARITIINIGIRWPNALTLDYSLSKLYWADARADKIESCDLNGGNRRTVLEKVGDWGQLNTSNLFVRLMLHGTIFNSKMLHKKS